MKLKNLIMKKLNSKLFENFNNNEIDNTSYIVGGMTSKKQDCNQSSNDDDNSGWRKDSSDSSDTTRSDDGCNEILLPFLG